MKNLQFISVLFLSMIVLSCSKDDSTDNPPTGETLFQANLDGGTYSNYAFTLGVYEITKASNGTMSIDIGDTNGNLVTLFLNGNGGFGDGVIKQIGNIDSNNFTTHAIIRQPQQVTYFSTTGNVKITTNREHPTKSGHRLISGTFNVTASTIDGSNVTTLIGSFNELDYTE